MSLQTILNESNSTLRKQMDETKGLVSKWNKTGLLEGIDSEYEKHGMAIMLENQAKQLVTEANSTGTAANSEQWSGVALPLVRRVFAEIAAKDFVSVQPMNLPSGLVFYMDFKYGTAQPGFQKGGTTSNDPMQGGYQVDSVFGVTNTTGDATGGLYGSGRFGYSINESIKSLYTSASLTPGAASASVQTVTVSNGTQDSIFDYDSKFIATYSGSTNFALITVSASALTNPDLQGVRAFVPTGSGVAAYFPQFTKVVTSAAGSSITFVVSGSLTGAASSVAVLYQVQPTAAQRGDFEDGNAVSPLGTDLGIPEINVELKSDPIVAKTRKLKAVWSPEFAQDLNAYHSIDAEAELTSMLSEYISQEIDLEILDMLIQNAVTTDYWSAQLGYEFSASANAGNGGFVQLANASAAAYNQGTWFQTLGTKIQKVSNKIHQKTMRGGANFIVCSPDIATVLESIPGYAADTNGDKMQFAMGVQKVGMLNSRFTVYKNPYMTSNIMLLGYRGSQFLETGAVYAPYIPLIMTPLVYDPTNFTPRKGVMTRYAKQMVRPEFYGTIKIGGLNFV
jgi:Major capsid protein Gp23